MFPAFNELQDKQSEVSLENIEFKQLWRDEYIKAFSIFINHFNEKKGVVCYHFTNTPFPPLAFSYVPKRGSSL